MARDLSILYRVFYEPRRAFAKFADGPRWVVLFPVIVIAIMGAGRMLVNLPREASAGFLWMPFGLVAAFTYSVAIMLFFPLLNAGLVHFVGPRIGHPQVAFQSLLTAFVLCAFPMYLGSVLGSISDVFHFGFAVFARLPLENQPFLYRSLLGITPFFLWTILLWWTALTVLQASRRYQRLAMVASLTVFDLILGALLSRAFVGFLRL